MRQTQVHYAALDANILVQIWANLSQLANQAGYDILKFGNVETIDNRELVTTEQAGEERE